MTHFASSVAEAMHNAAKPLKQKHQGKRVAGSGTEQSGSHIVVARSIDELKGYVGEALLANPHATDKNYEDATLQLIHEGQHRYAAVKILGMKDDEVEHHLAFYRRGIGPYRSTEYQLRTVLPPHELDDPERVSYVTAFPEVLSSDDELSLAADGLSVATAAHYAATHNLRPLLSSVPPQPRSHQ